MRKILVTTKSGDKPVGALLKLDGSTGSLILLPDIDFYGVDFVKAGGAGHHWTRDAKQFATRMISAVIALDRNLHSSSDLTPEPEWATDSRFTLRIEAELQSKIIEVEREIEEIQKKKEKLGEEIKISGALRALLFEKGKPLEHAIIEALRLLGFQACSYKDDQSEFDVVFTCPEGRLIGEAEGKDSKAVNVDKLRQLAMNIHEDLVRDDVDEAAKGVLFGNGYRLLPPDAREAQFTDKCISAAKLSSVALVSTADLFEAAKYLSDHNDSSYSNICRRIILEGVGLIVFPKPPQSSDLVSNERL